MKAVTAIGAYSGMRLNEICTLRESSIKNVEGVLCFEITEGKTKSAARIVPVHSKIIPLVKSLLKTTHSGFLFYHASITDRADGKRSTWHTQQFTREDRIALLVGHERGVTESFKTYSKNAVSAQEVKEYVELVKHVFDLPIYNKL